MKKFTAKIVAIIMVFGMLGFAVPAFAAGDGTPSKEIVINKFQNKDPLIVNKKIKIEVLVQSDDPKNPAKTIKNEDKALVYVFFTKGKDQRQATMTLSKNGKYEGSIKLPKAGQWKVNVMAMVPDPALGANGTDKLETTWNVKEPKTSVWVWVLYGVGAVLVILIIGFIIRGVRKRKARKEAEKKAKLQQKKKVKKSKKKR